MDRYNTVSLGFAIWAIACIMNDHDLLGAIMFTLSLNFKQMSLYYAPAFFFYLLSKSFHKYNKLNAIKHVIMIGIVTIGTFGLLWYPFYHANGVQGLLNVNILVTSYCRYYIV